MSDGEEYFYCREKQGVKDIIYHEPQDEGDAHYCDVTLKNKTTLRIFKPNAIEFTED